MQPELPDLPVKATLADLATALGEHRSAVLVAPPGAGKTTLVPLALLGAPWLRGKRILMLEPRRLAARAAARRMASLLGEEVGATVGYAVRFERMVGPHTRIEVVTEGVLARRLQQDPELGETGLVIFDELHERSLDTDLTLALVLDARAGLRPDLGILAMSATLEIEPVAALLGGAPILRSEGRRYPVETLHRSLLTGERLEDAVTAAALEAVARFQGDVLVFLPGAAEIRRVQQRLGDQAAGFLVAPLYGDLPRAAQDLALRPATDRRKIVLATDIAETSLTIEGVRVVVDSGLARKPRFSARTGMSRLETIGISLASADQRRGRAGRQGPGWCIRLWAEPQERAMAKFSAPEIADADLASLALELASWGAPDPSALRWLTPPPAAALDQARRTLADLSAIDGEQRITELGRRMAALPLHPRLAAMVVGAERDEAATAVALATMLASRTPWRDTDLALRLAAWAAGGGEPGARRELERVAAQIRRRAGIARHELRPDRAGALLARAFPDRIAQARGEGRGTFRLMNGRGAALDPADPLGRAELLVVADLDDKGADPRIFGAAELSRADLEQIAAMRIHTVDELTWDEASEALAAQRVTRLGAIVLKRREARDLDPDAAKAALLAQIRKRGLGWLPWGEAATGFRRRQEFVHRHDPTVVPAVDDESLLTTLEAWLGPWIDGITRRRDLDRADLRAALEARLDQRERRALREMAPPTWLDPSGRERRIDYAREPPTVSARLQELLGLDRHPTVMAGRVSLALELLSPAARPVQVTRDLPAFWRGSYAEVRKQMRGRYPKHHWPEDPLGSVPVQRRER